MIPTVGFTALELGRQIVLKLEVLRVEIISETFSEWAPLRRVCRGRRHEDQHGQWFH